MKKEKGSLLILGGSGLLGSALINDEQLKSNFNITATFRTNQISLPHIQWVYFDGNNDDMHAISDKPFDLIINCIGLVDLDFCELHPDIAHNINTEIPVALTKHLNKKGQKFIHISTDGLFSKDKGPFNENTPTNPCNVYARTKAEADMRVLKENPNAIVLRFSFLTRNKYHSQRGLINNICNMIIDQKPIKAIDDWYFNPITIQHLSQLITNLYKNKCRNISGIFHVYSKDTISKGYMVRKFADLDLEIDDEIKKKFTKIKIEKARLQDFTFIAHRPQYQVLASARLSEIPFFKPQSLFVKGLSCYD